MRMGRFPRLWMILLLAVLVAVVCWPSARVLGEQWTDFANITYTHGWLIVAVCVVLVIAARREIEAAPARVSPVALAALAAAVLVWLVCYRASFQDLHITIAPVIFWLAVTAAFGGSVGRLLVFPAAFFLFAEPSWSELTAPLQELTVRAMRSILSLTGPQAVISGDLIQVPNGTFEIQGGCSGLHYLIVGLAVAALQGELRRDPWKVRLAQLALMAVLALVANWVRVYGVIEAGYLSDMHSSLLRNHYWFGWGLFGVALFAFFWITGRWPEAPAPGATATMQPAVSPRLWTDLGRVAVAALVLVLIPSVSAALRLQAPLAKPRVDANPRTPWVAAPVDVHSSWQPSFAGAAVQQRLAYTDGGPTVELFSVTYLEQRQDAKLLAAGNSLGGRQLLLRSEAVMTGPAGRFRESEMVDRAYPHDLFVIWTRYQSAGREFVNPLLAQFWYGLNATVAHPAASLIAFRAACRPDCVAARRTLGDFAASGALH
jgi:exosortase